MSFVELFANSLIGHPSFVVSFPLLIFYFFFFIVIGHVESVEKPVNPRDFNDSLRGQMWARDVNTL